MKSSPSKSLPKTADSNRIRFGAGFRLPATKPVR
jgi:hypothetical protein